MTHPPRVRDARVAASDWVTRNMRDAPGFLGAYLAGSVATLPDSTIIPPSSDTDVMVVLNTAPHGKPGKLMHHGILLDITLLDAGRFQSEDAVLGDYHLAAGLAAASIMMDPTGWMRVIQRAVEDAYPCQTWVNVRWSAASRKAASGLEAVANDGFLPRQVMGWIFPTGILAHVPLVAAMRNPTVRRRYEAAREVLTEFERDDVYGLLLWALGATALTSADVERAMAPMSEVFDAAAAVANAPFPYASDISPQARRIAIDGSWEMIARGSHREAVFWMVVTWCRALMILRFAGGDSAVDRWLGQFHDLIAMVGIHDDRDVIERAQRSRSLIPSIEAAARDIVARNPAVIDG